MADLKLAPSFSLMALNAQNSLHMSVAKEVALRCMAAAVVLEAYLDSGSAQSTEKSVFQEDILSQPVTRPYWEVVLKPMLNKKSKERNKLEWWLKKASSLSYPRLKKLEYAIVGALKENRFIEEIPNLLGCDLYYDSAGVEMKEYRSDMDEFTAVTEEIRAEILEDGTVTDEAICMLWLLRESGCIHDLFSQNDLEKVAARMHDLSQHNELAKTLYSVHIHRGMELTVKRFLHFKKTVLKIPFATGVTFAFPFLERSQSIFIETEAWFSNSQKRLEDVKHRLESHGHALLVLSEGQVPLIKVDNIVYEAIPQAIYQRIPIHGVRLLPRRPKI